MASPQDPTGEQAELRHRRTLISQVLVAGLVSVAYSVPIATVQEAIKHTVSIRTAGLFVVYAITVLRFFVGNILHLESEELTGRGSERKWFWDLAFIVAEFIVIIFMGTVASLLRSSQEYFTFFDWLFALCIVDIAWLASIHLLNAISNWAPKEPALPRRALLKLTKPFKRDRSQLYPGWFVINAVMAVGLWLLGFLGHPASPLPTWKLWLLVIATVVVSIIDIYVLNYNMAEREFG